MFSRGFTNDVLRIEVEDVDIGIFVYHSRAHYIFNFVKVGDAFFIQEVHADEVGSESAADFSDVFLFHAVHLSGGSSSSEFIVGAEVRGIHSHKGGDNFIPDDIYPFVAAGFHGLLDEEADFFDFVRASTVVEVVFYHEDLVSAVAEAGFQYKGCAQRRLFAVSDDMGLGNGDPHGTCKSVGSGFVVSRTLGSGVVEASDTFFFERHGEIGVIGPHDHAVGTFGEIHAVCHGYAAVMASFSQGFSEEEAEPFVPDVSLSVVNYEILHINLVI